MGRELGPGFQRRPPRGWLPARAFPIERELLDHYHDGTGGAPLIETAHRYRFTWEVRVGDRAPLSFTEVRNAPVWVRRDSPAGSRWYKPRLRASYGLMANVGVPGFVDPQDPTRLWVDWDAAYEEHEQAWEQQGRVDREIARREGGLEYVTHRILNPLQGKASADDAAAVQEELERRHERDERILAEGRERARELGFGPVEAGSEQARRIAQLRRLQREGRRVKGVIVGQVDTGRTVADQPLIEVTIEIDDGDGKRRVVYEHIWGARAAATFKPGRRVKVTVDPADPDVVEIG
jgi:hypothetical protein